MEKFKPHCELSTVKAMLQAGKVRITTSALAGGDALGLHAKEIVSIVMALTLKDFYKSMTSHNNHREWQDVYRPITYVGTLYIKLIVADDVLVLSFKER
ncbi:MAG TPA: type II toxin-antitoxin system MqsR family toxin [Ktedonobacteraceae bacterium]|nr:type II toxin-antitoxin system MqsR family toxin [Ktedonobacteraceae bacterium]